MKRKHAGGGGALSPALIEKKAELLQLLNSAQEWHSAGELGTTLKVSSSPMTKLTRLLMAEGEIAAMKPPPGYGMGIRAIYAAKGVAALEGSTPLTDKAPAKRAKRLPRKVKGNRAMLRDKKRKGKQSPPADTSKVEQRVALTDMGRELLGDVPLWAFASDNTLMLIGSAIKIKQHEARALVRFLHDIDEAGFLGAGGGR